MWTATPDQQIKLVESQTSCIQEQYWLVCSSHSKWAMSHCTGIPSINLCLYMFKYTSECPSAMVRGHILSAPWSPATLPVSVLGVPASPAAVDWQPLRNPEAQVDNAVLLGHWGAGRSHRAHQASLSGLRSSPQTECYGTGCRPKAGCPRVGHSAQLLWN